MSKLPSVALVSRSNSLGGGASRIAEELSEWLISAGCRVIHYCASSHGQLKSFQKPLYPQDAFGKLSRLTHRFTRRIGLNELFPSEFFGILSQCAREFDIIHFHDLNLAVSPLTLSLAARNTNVVFTAHDCSSFTGGCTYPLGCERYSKRCGKCPQLSTIGAKFDFTSLNLGVSRWMARNAAIQYVFPSNWLRTMAARTVSFARRPEVIPNGFSDARYEFVSKACARQRLGIRERQRVILVAAHYLADPRKGVKFALAAINSVSDLNPLIIFVGYPPSDLEVKLPGIGFWLTGFISDKPKLGLLFASADIFLFTSLEDNLPIMVQEALSAGTPVVGFGAGGVPEIVEHKRTGWLCAPGDQEKLNQNLRLGLMSDDLSSFSDAARQSIRDRFDMNAFGQQNLKLYEGMIK